MRTYIHTHSCIQALIHTYIAASLVADARAGQGQLELVLASAGVAELEEVNKVILLLPLYSVVACSLYPCSLFIRVVRSVVSLLLTCDGPPALCGFQKVSVRGWEREAG